MTQKAKVGGHTVYVTVGFFEDGTPCEVFLDVSRTGSAARAWAGAAAMLASMLLQRGATVAEVANALGGITDSPDGEVRVEGCEGVETARGILDFASKVLRVYA